MQRGCFTTQIGRPKGWKLTTIAEDDSHEEIVLRVQGIVSDKDLPPISKTTNM
jgi:hypothetical protein